VTNVAVLAGGVGAARLLRGMIRALPPTDVTAIVNVGDDMELHGLHISPDLDTVTYTLAEAINTETGWGLSGETWQAMDSLARYGGITWFGLGDKDLATHMYRTQRLREGASLSEITAHIARSWDLDLTIVPVSDDELRTHVTLVDEGEVTFQEYFVERQHNVAVEAVRFAGAESATPAPGVIDALTSAEVIVVAPSNPVVSIGPLLAVPGIREVLTERRDRVVAVSPIVGGKALKGPADRLLTELGHEASAVGVARMYQPFASVLAIDTVDAALAPDIAAAGITPLVAPTIMTDADIAAQLCATLIDSIVKGSS
jgi:LPPG:FO 2-phospho-L-lactate transferase